MQLRNVKLRDYQERILEELSCVPSIGLFMKTGSGKTITSLARIEKNPTKHILVVCPQKIVSQWVEVVEKFTDLKPCIYNVGLSSAKKNTIINNYLNDDSIDEKCIIINFDILNKMDWLDNVNDDWTIVIDESHKIKNMYKTNRKGDKVTGGFTTAAALELGKKTDYKIILTATPTEKANGGYVDFYTQMRFLGYMDMSYTLFKNRYCREESKQIQGLPFPIKTITGYRMAYIDKEIKPLIQSCCRYFAPKYADYEPDMIKIDIERTKSYARMIEHKVYEEITLDNVSSSRIARKTITAGVVSGTNEYGDRLVYQDNTFKSDWLKEFLSNTDDVVSILYNYNVEKDIIVKACEDAGKKYIVINGEVKDKPAELKKEFDVVIGQYEAFGESLDGLQHKCHLMVFFSMPDSSRAYKQSLGRIDRVGQEEKPVYYHLIMKNTIDKVVYDMVNSKIEFSKKDLDDMSLKDYEMER